MIEDNSASRQTDERSANFQSASDVQPTDVQTKIDSNVEQSSSRLSDTNSNNVSSRESTSDKLRKDSEIAGPSYSHNSGAVKSDWASKSTESEKRGELPRFDLEDPKSSGKKSSEPGPAKSDTATGAGEHTGKMHDGSTTSVSQETLMNNVKVVADVAKDKGVDPATAVASMLVESGGNHKVVGDHGTSFGLFQLHKGGELGDLSQKEASNPRTNADVALSEFARIQHKHSNPGKLAAAAQRPAHPEQYAKKVNAMLPDARRLLDQADV